MPDRRSAIAGTGVDGSGVARIGDWPEILPAFATYMAEAAARAAVLRPGTPLVLTIDPPRLGDEVYRRELVGTAQTWRDRRGTSTVYVLTYAKAASSDRIEGIVDDAHERCRSKGKPRAFPQRGGRADSPCLYVGHSLTFDRRLRDHLGDGTATTSSLHLRYWDRHPFGDIEVRAYPFAEHDVVLARIFEEYLWDHLRPVLGRRGGR